jgi:hypothetical protein
MTKRVAGKPQRPNETSRPYPFTRQRAFALDGIDHQSGHRVASTCESRVEGVHDVGYSQYRVGRHLTLGTSGTSDQDESPNGDRELNLLAHGERTESVGRDGCKTRSQGNRLFGRDP